MKKRVFVICGLLVLCIIIFVVISLLNDNEANLNSVDNVTMEIGNGSLTNTGTTIIITNLSGEDIFCGSWYRIDKLEDEKWYELEDIVDGNVVWDMIGYVVKKDNTLTLDIDWKGLYGSLESGNYRIVKEFSNEKNPYDTRQVAAEFTIE